MPYFEENIIFQRNDFLFYKIIDMTYGACLLFFDPSII